MSHLYRLAATADDIKDAVICLGGIVRDLEAERDAKLGAMVRKLPTGFDLYRCIDKGRDLWQLVYLHHVYAEGDTPEAALAVLDAEAVPPAGDDVARREAEEEDTMTKEELIAWASQGGTK